MGFLDEIDAWLKDVYYQIKAFFAALFDPRNLAITMTLIFCAVVLFYVMFVVMGYEHIFGKKLPLIKNCANIPNAPAFGILVTTLTFLLSALIAVGASMHYVWSRFHKNLHSKQRSSDGFSFFISFLVCFVSGTLAIILAINNCR